MKNLRLPIRQLARQPAERLELSTVPETTPGGQRNFVPAVLVSTALWGRESRPATPRLVRVLRFRGGAYRVEGVGGFLSWLEGPAEKFARRLYARESYAVLVARWEIDHGIYRTEVPWTPPAD